MPRRITVQLPVSVEVSDEELEAAETALDVVGALRRTVKDPHVRAAAQRVGRLVDGWRRRRAAR